MSEGIKKQDLLKELSAETAWGSESHTPESKKLVIYMTSLESDADHTFSGGLRDVIRKLEKKNPKELSNLHATLTLQKTALENLKKLLEAKKNGGSFLMKEFSQLIAEQHYGFPGEVLTYLEREFSSPWGLFKQKPFIGKKLAGSDFKKNEIPNENYKVSTKELERLDSALEILLKKYSQAISACDEALPSVQIIEDPVNDNKQESQSEKSKVA